MPLRFPAALLLALAGAITIIGCGGIVDPSQNQIQTITGVLQPGGRFDQKFSSQSGEISVKVGSLTPASTPYIGVLWVQQAGDGSCTGNVFGNNQFVPGNTTAISASITSGNYCVSVYDPFGYPQPVSYSFTLSHP